MRAVLSFTLRSLHPPSQRLLYCMHRLSHLCTVTVPAASTVSVLLCSWPTCSAPCACTQGNLQLVVNVAKEFTEQLGITALIELFESFSNYHGLYFFLGSRMATTENPEEHFKYIEAAVKTGEQHDSMRSHAARV